jgi:ribosomal protein S21
MEQYQRNNQFKKSWDNKPKREWKPKPPMPPGCNYHAEVRDGDDPMRAYRKIKKRIKDDKFFDILKEKQYYQKPSFKRREKSKKRRIVLKKLQRERDSNVFMGRPARG